MNVLLPTYPLCFLFVDWHRTVGHRTRSHLHATFVHIAAPHGRRLEGRRGVDCVSQGACHRADRCDEDAKVCGVYFARHFGGTDFWLLCGCGTDFGFAGNLSSATVTYLSAPSIDVASHVCSQPTADHKGSYQLTSRICESSKNQGDSASNLATLISCWI